MTDTTSENILKTPPQWKRPDEVMRMHRLKIKKQSLQCRMKGCEAPKAPETKKVEESKPSEPQKAFRNPFKKPLAGPANCSGVKRLREEDDEEDTSLDSSLFRLMGIKKQTQPPQLDLNFSNLMKKINSSDQEFLNVGSRKKRKFIPVDWTLRTRIRLMSSKPFPWNHKLKTCEEASGTTGFVRCVDTQSKSADSNCTLDTSPNARFHQCCLVWQYPSLPWLELYPRSAARRSAASTTINFNSHPNAKNALFQEWTESFRSVFQLVRAQQCPYFYLLANSFTVLFRAAGICGYSEIHAFISPTTRGLRQLLKNEDVEFSMPLKGSGNKTTSKRRSGEVDSDNVLESTQGLPSNDNDEDLEVEDDGTEEILEKLGAEASDIKKLIQSEDETMIQNEANIDGTPESLVCVQGVEAQALFNLLLNFRSTVATVGPLAGVPPTLIAPVAFHSAFLRPLKVHESKLRTKDGANYYSMEICGPILPQMIHNICDLLHVPLSEFSLTFANVESTKPFSLAHSAVQEETSDSYESPNKSCHSESNHSGISVGTRHNIPSVFGQQNLSDSGLRASVLKRFCSSKLDDVQTFDSLKFSNGVFECS
ncbi:unnamed protein product [Bemisia tabaci]|uniref:Uncharacterized protein n=1 Tax=Bemisia tabaci TaxID=7038 RepID=A0A9P0F2M2_BEMTA|nr:unnamed protein product [Bemisia tabaci]